MIQRDDILSMEYLKKTEFTGCHQGMRYRLEQTTDPVSYTHLDVYKRQPPNSQSCKAIGTDPQCFKYYNGVFNKTQEDVYKRQV